MIYKWYVLKALYRVTINIAIETNLQGWIISIISFDSMLNCGLSGATDQAWYTYLN